MNPDEMKGRPIVAENLGALEVRDHPWIVYAQLRAVKSLQT